MASSCGIRTRWKWLSASKRYRWRLFVIATKNLMCLYWYFKDIIRFFSSSSVGWSLKLELRGEKNNSDNLVYFNLEFTFTKRRGNFSSFLILDELKRTYRLIYILIPCLIILLKSLNSSGFLIGSSCNFKREDLVTCCICKVL